MTPRIPIRTDLRPARITGDGAPRPARPRAAAPIKRPTGRFLPALLDADLDGPAALASPRRPIADRLVDVLARIALAAFLAGGYAIGLKLYAGVSPLEGRAILVLAGFFAFFLMVTWPTFCDEEPNGDYRSRSARRSAPIREISAARSKSVTSLIGPSSVRSESSLMQREGRGIPRLSRP